MCVDHTQGVSQGSSAMSLLTPNSKTPSLIQISGEGTHLGPLAFWEQFLYCCTAGLNGLGSFFPSLNLLTPALVWYRIHCPSSSWQIHFFTPVKTLEFLTFNSCLSCLMAVNKH